ncbi:SCO2322 family protein, partial [Streptomyces bohaiensis]
VMGSGPALQLTGDPVHDAPTGYRYWSFWLRDTADTADTADGTDEETDGGPDESWRYATEGPGTLRPADGAVLGFRFGIGTGTGGAEQPRPTDTFAAVCDATEAGADERRVALVLDFGTRDEAPPGEVPPPPATVCAVVADGATGAETLAAVAGPLRYDRAGLLCAIRGYPERGCGEQASAAPQDSAGAEGGDEGGSTGAGEDGFPGGVGLWVGIAAVAALAAAALGRGRRRDR